MEIGIKIATQIETYSIILIVLQTVFCNLEFLLNTIKGSTITRYTQACI